MDFTKLVIAILDRKMQSPDIETIGCFLYSYEKQYTETLSEILSNLCCIHVACRRPSIKFGPKDAT